MKITIAAKFGWLFTNSDGSPFILRKLSIKKWIDKSNPTAKTFPKLINNANWSFKTNLFPNFSHSTVFKPKTTKTYTSNNNATIQNKNKYDINSSQPSLKRKTSPLSVKHPAKRVTFNLSSPVLDRHPPLTPPSPTSSSSIPRTPQNTDLRSVAKEPNSVLVTTSSKSSAPPNAYLPNFIHSHTLNQPSAPVSNKQSKTQQALGVPTHPESSGFLNPLIPPVVKLTKQLSDTSIEGRYVMARLRDHKIYNSVRLYLAYLHDKPDSVCFDGKTNTNLKVLISQEGLPIDRKELLHIFVQFHDSLSINPSQVANDLSSFASFISSKRVSYLQKSRSDFKSYYRS